MQSIEGIDEMQGMSTIKNINQQDRFDSSVAIIIKIIYGTFKESKHRKKMLSNLLLISAVVTASSQNVAGTDLSFACAVGECARLHDRDILAHR
jgi:hypothetical protein